MGDKTNHSGVHGHCVYVDLDCTNSIGLCCLLLVTYVLQVPCSKVTSRREWRRSSQRIGSMKLTIITHSDFVRPLRPTTIISLTQVITRPKNKNLLRDAPISCLISEQ